MSTKILDHIVHLTPPSSASETIEQWKKLGFNVIPGGTHADGLTANALIILSDSAYIELIHFTHPVSYYPPDSPERRARESHSWASKQPGWIDFAFLGFGSSNLPADANVDLADVVNERAEREKSGAQYEKSVSGGRTRPDGQVLKWKITAPAVDRHSRGLLPFFCGDVTERVLRVPTSVTSIEHPNTSKGISHVRLLASSSDYATFKAQISSVVGTQPTSSSHVRSSWDLETPASTSLPNTAKTHIPQLILTVASSTVEEEYLKTHGPGIFELAFRVDGGRAGEANSPFGRVVWKE